MRTQITVPIGRKVRSDEVSHALTQVRRLRPFAFITASTLADQLVIDVLDSERVDPAQLIQAVNEVLQEKTTA